MQNRVASPIVPECRSDFRIQDADFGVDPDPGLWIGFKCVMGTHPFLGEVWACSLVDRLLYILMRCSCQTQSRCGNHRLCPVAGPQCPQYGADMDLDRSLGQREFPTDQLIRQTAQNSLKDVDLALCESKATRTRPWVWLRRRRGGGRAQIGLLHRLRYWHGLRRSLRRSGQTLTRMG